jgi:acyl carrier protein
MIKFNELLAESLGVSSSEISLNLVFRSHPKWDSLAALTMITAIEDEFGLILNDTELQKLITVQDLIAFIDEHKKL